MLPPASQARRVSPTLEPRDRALLRSRRAPGADRPQPAARRLECRRPDAGCSRARHLRHGRDRGRKYESVPATSTPAISSPTTPCSFVEHPPPSSRRRKHRATRASVRNKRDNTPRTSSGSSVGRCRSLCTRTGTTLTSGTLRCTRPRRSSAFPRRSTSNGSDRSATRAARSPSS